MTPVPTTNQELSGPPWYSSAAFWTGPFTIGLALLVAVGIGLAWYILGGFPRDHDKYGSLSVPERRILQLPEGDVRVNFENDTTGSGDTRIIRERPEGLAVRVSPAGGGEQLEVKHVPGWLFSSSTGDRGRELFGKVEVPSARSYRIQVTEDAPAFDDRAAASRPASGTDSGPKITIGQGPWSPLGSVVLSAILAGLAVFLTVLLLTLPVRLIS